MVMMIGWPADVDDNDDRLAPNGHLRVYQALAAGFWSVSRVGICKFFFQQKKYFLGKSRVSIFLCGKFQPLALLI